MREVADDSVPSNCHVSCGHLAGDLELRIVDPDSGTLCPPNRIGEIWLRGDSISPGYWRQLHDESFQAVPRGENGRWFRTGDYGFTRGDELYVTGRLKDIIIIRGRKIYPQDIEAVVERSIPFVPANGCVAFATDLTHSEGLAVVVEADRAFLRTVTAAASFDPAPEETAVLWTLVDKVCHAVLDEADVAIQTLTFVRPGTFPRTSSGKLQRSATREALGRNNLDIVFAWNAINPRALSFPGVPAHITHTSGDSHDTG